MNSIKLENRRNTIFINSSNSKKSDTHRLLINLPYNVNSKISDMLLYQTLALTIHGKI